MTKKKTKPSGTIDLDVQVIRDSKGRRITEARAAEIAESTLTYRDGQVINGPVTDVHGTVWTTAKINDYLASVYGPPPPGAA